MAYTVYPEPVAATPESMPIGASRKIQNGALKNLSHTEVNLPYSDSGAFVIGDVAVDYQNGNGNVSVMCSSATSTFIPNQSGGMQLSLSERSANPLASATTRTMPQNRMWSSVAYGLGRFVAVALGDSTYTPNTTSTAYSYDGVTWSQVATPVSAKWISVAFGGTRFVTVAQDSNASMYSTDGANWIAGGNLPASTTWTAVSYGNGRFVAVSNSGYIAYSTDGSSWTQAGASIASAMCVGYGGDVWVIGIYNSSNCAYSTDNGVTWTTTSVGNTRNYMAVAYGNGRFVLAGHDGFAYSSNGITGWTNGGSGGFDYATDMVFANGQFVAINGQSKNTYTVSNDGLNWTAKTHTGGNAYWSGIAYGPSDGTFVTVPGYVFNYGSGSYATCASAAIQSPIQSKPFGVYAGPTTTY